MTANPAEWPGILMSGPLPPPPGGMASVLAMLAESSLARRVRLELFDTAKRTPEGRSAWQGWVARASLMRRWWRQLGELPAAIAHIHTCSGLTFFLDGLLATPPLGCPGVEAAIKQIGVACKACHQDFRG